MAAVKLEQTPADGGKKVHTSQPDDEGGLPASSPPASGRKRRRNPRHETSAPAAARRSTRPRAAPKQYTEEAVDSHFQRTGKGRAQWKEDELERLLDSLKKLQRTDNVRSVKKHVKTKNLEQVEAKIEYLRKKALERALKETISMPPLQCWETLVQDVTSTLSDESYREISKVFWTATSEPLASSSNAKSDPSQPNYNEVYKFLAALLRGTQPTDLSPIDAMVVLECLNNTVEFLQNLEMNDQTSFLQKRYEDLFFKLYSTNPSKSQTTKAGATHSGASSSKRPRADHCYDKPSTSGSSMAEQEADQANEPIGLGTLNPLNIPVDKLNLIRPPACSQHGNPYCWIPACREKNKTQQTST